MSRGKAEEEMAPRASSSNPTVSNTSAETLPAIMLVHDSFPAAQSTSNAHLLHKFGNELCCPLCKQFMQNPVLTKACLHRFCSQCIHKYMAKGLKTCPTCSTPLPIKVALESDYNLAAILAKLLPQPREMSKQDALQTMIRDGVDLDFYKRPRSSLKQPLSNSSEPTTPVLCASASVPPSPKISRSSTTESLKTSPPWSSSEAASTSHTNVNSHQTNNTNHFQNVPGLIPLLPKEQNFASSSHDDSNKIAATYSPIKVEEDNPACTSHITSPPEFNGALKRRFPPVLDLPTQMLLAQKQRLNKEIYVELVLWPDSWLRRQAHLPGCIRSPRYIYVPANATVAHLIEYLVVRAEVEAGWKDRQKYCVEITHVEEEPDEFALIVDRTKNDISCSYPELGVEASQKYTLLIKNDKDNYRIMLRTAHPFQPLNQDLTVAALASSYHANYKKPLKVVYQFVKKK